MIIKKKFQTYRGDIFIHKDILFLFQLFAGKYFFVWWRESMGFERRAWLRLRIYWKKRGPTETRTRIVGFKVQSDSHYTIGPPAMWLHKKIINKGKKACISEANSWKVHAKLFVGTDVFKECPIGSSVRKIFTFLQWKTKFVKIAKVPVGGSASWGNANWGKCTLRNRLEIQPLDGRFFFQFGRR